MRWECVIWKTVFISWSVLCIHCDLLASAASSKYIAHYPGASLLFSSPAGLLSCNAACCSLFPFWGSVVTPKPWLWEFSSVRAGIVEKPNAQFSKTHGPAVHATLFGRSIGQKYMFFFYLYKLETKFSYGHAPTALGLLCCFFKQCIPTYADGCTKQILTSQGGSLWMKMREIFLFKVGGQCYWRKEGIIVPKTFWQELAKTQLNDPDKIMMIPLAARIVSV